MFHARPVLWHDTLHIFSKLFHGASIWCHALLRPARKSAALLLMAHTPCLEHASYLGRTRLAWRTHLAWGVQRLTCAGA